MAPFLKNMAGKNILNTTEKSVYRKGYIVSSELIFLSAPTNRAVHTIQSLRYCGAKQVLLEEFVFLPPNVYL